MAEENLDFSFHNEMYGASFCMSSQNEKKILYADLKNLMLHLSHELKP